MFLLSNVCFAEGQAGLENFFLTALIAGGIIYTLIIGLCILLVRKINGHKNSKRVIWISFLTGAIFAVVTGFYEPYYLMSAFFQLMELFY